MKKEKPQGRTTANLSTLERPENVPVKPSVDDVATIASLIMAGVNSAGFTGKKLSAEELAMLRSTMEGVDSDGSRVRIGELSESQLDRIKELCQAGAVEAVRTAVIAETRRDLEQCGIAMADEFYDALRKRANASRAAELRPGSRRGSIKYWEGLIEIVQNDNGTHSAVLLGEVQKAYTKIVEPKHSELSVAHSLLLASTKVMGKEGPLAQLFNAVRFAPDDKREEVALKAKAALCLVVDSLARKLPHTLHKSRKRMTLPGRGQVPLAFVAIEEFQTWVLRHRDLPTKGELQLLIIEKHPSLPKLSAAAWTHIWDDAGLAILRKSGGWELADAKAKARAKLGKIGQPRSTTRKPK
ncbi:hypothetical protein [Prosthecobacter sp.]|jgi:hypothetical protein|uniref:hypothetical protein n=1 Tax=Prosthecobacter sp. TaxID=1965333 RepID=UPI0037C7D124